MLYQAMGRTPPIFAHVSIILATDRSKLSKRHGATSVGQFAEMGYLPAAMMNYLSLLGWNDGTEQELFTEAELKEKFSVERIVKSAAVFDKDKLTWMNGQILRSLEDSEKAKLLKERLVKLGLMDATTPDVWVDGLVAMTAKSLELLADGEREVLDMVAYPLSEVVASEEAQEVMNDGFGDVVDVILAAYEDGSLAAATATPGDFKKWIKGVGKEMDRKGKRLFMPVRMALTGRMHGADVGEQMSLLGGMGEFARGEAKEKMVDLDARMQALAAWRKG